MDLAQLSPTTGFGLGVRFATSRDPTVLLSNVIRFKSQTRNVPRIYISLYPSESEPEDDSESLSEELELESCTGPATA